MKQSHKTLLLWVLLILMFVAIYQLVAAPEAPRSVAFSEFTTDVEDEGWGLITTLKVPGHGEIGLYQPAHPSPLEGVGTN